MKIIKTPATVMHHTYLADQAGCGYIRCVFPSMLLSQYTHGNRIHFFPCTGMNFINDESYYKSMFFVMFQRSATPQQLNLIKYFKSTLRAKTKTPMLYEIDDLLTDIPSWNFASDYYKEYSLSATEIMKLMDGMIVSTNRLRDIYSKFNINIQVQPNHLVKGFWGEPEWKEHNNKKLKILWAGSGNHFSQKDNVKGGDFDKELINFINKTTDKYEWNFIGGVPLELKDNNKIIKHDWIPLFNYPNYIKSLNIDLAIAPLEQNIFNECKSNIKALEYTAAGIPAIFTDIEPYKMMPKKFKEDIGIIDFIESIDNQDILKDLWKKNLKVLKYQLFWENNNNLPKYYNKLISFFNMKLPK